MSEGTVTLIGVGILLAILAVVAGINAGWSGVLGVGIGGGATVGFVFLLAWVNRHA